MNTDNLSSNIKRYRSKMNRREQVLAQVSKWLNDFAFLEALLSDKEEYKLQTVSYPVRKRSEKHYRTKARRPNICSKTSTACIELSNDPW